MAKRTSRSRASQPQRKGIAPSILSLIGGVGIGTAVMYLMDPQAGSDRRERIARAATDAAHGAGEALETTWHGVTDTAHRAAATMQSAGHDAVDRGHHASRSLAASLHDLKPAARRFYSRALPAMQTRRDARHEVLKDALLVTAAAALGAGLMMLLDPSEGHRRRAAIREKVSDGIDETTRLARNTGRYIAEKTHAVSRPDDAADVREDVPQTQI